MTIPGFTPTEENPTPSYPAGWEGVVAGAMLSSLTDRTEQNVRTMLREQIQQDGVWSTLWEKFWDFVTLPLQWLFNILEKMFPRLPWDDIRDFDIIGIAEWVVDQLSEVPLISNLFEWITGIANVTWENFVQWFSNLRDFLAGINFFGQNFNLRNATIDFIEFVLFPVDLIFKNERWQAFLDKFFPNRPGGTTTDDDVVQEFTNISDAVTTVTENVDTALEGVNQVIDSNDGLISRSTNIIINSGFESGLFAQGGGDYVNKNLPGGRAYSGDRSLRMVGRGQLLQPDKYTFLSDDSKQRFIPVTEEDVFYVSFFLYGDDGNDQTSGGDDGIQFTVEPFNDAGNPIPNSTAAFKIDAGDYLNGQWSKVEGIIRMPAGAVRAKVTLQLTNAVEWGEKYFFDDVTLREVTIADRALTAAELAGQTIDAAYGNATEAAEFGRDVAASGSNIIVNGDFEKGWFAQPGVATYSNDYAYSGFRSLKMVGNGTSDKKYVLLSDDAKFRFIPVSPLDTFQFEFYVRGSGYNEQTSGGEGAVKFLMEPFTASGVECKNPDNTSAQGVVNITASTALNFGWAKIAGFYTVPADAARMKVSFEVTDNVRDGDAYYFDAVSLREVTLAKTADDKAQEALDSIDQSADDAVLAKDFALNIVSAGDNIIINPSFESGLFDGQADGQFTSIFQSKGRTGFRALKMVGGLGEKKYTLNSDDTNLFGFIPAVPGDWFQFEVWCKADENNEQTTGGVNAIKFVFEPHNKAGQKLDDSVISQSITPALKADWVRIGGFMQMPPETAKVKISLRLAAAGPGGNTGVKVGDIIYFDDVVVRSVTVAKKASDNVDQTVDAIAGAVDEEAPATGNAPSTVKPGIRKMLGRIFDGLNNEPAPVSTDRGPLQVFNAAKATRSRANDAFTNANGADGKAGLAQNRADLAATAGGNLCPNSGFEDTTFYLSPSPAASYSTVQKRSGLRSVTVPAGSASTDVYVIATSTEFAKVTASEGDIFYAEFWAYGSLASNAVTMRFSAFNSSNVNIANYTVGTAMATANGWTKFSGTTFAMPANTSYMTVYLRVPTSVVDMFLDDVIVREVSMAQNAIDAVGQSVNGGNATNQPPTTVRSNLQLAWARMWDGLNGSASPASTSKLPADVYTVGKAARDRADLGVNLAGTADGKAVIADGKAVGADGKAQGAVDGIGEAVDGVATTGRQPGTVKTNLQLAWARMWDGLNGNASPTSTSKLPSDVFTVGRATRQQADLGVNNASTADGKAVTADTKAQNTVDGVGQAVDGAGTTGRAAGTVRTNLQLAWARMWDGLNGSPSASATSKLPADVYAVGKAARDQADLGVNNAGTADGKAVLAASAAATADGKAVTAAGAAATADTKAVTADTLASIASGQNGLVQSPDFDESSVRRFINASNSSLFVGSYATDRFVTGTQSYKITMTGTGTAGDNGWLALNPYKSNSAVVWFNIVPGEVYKYDFLYYRTGSSAKTMAFNVIYRLQNGTQNSTTTTVALPQVFNSWQRATGTFTVPALIPATTGSAPLQMVLQIGFSSGAVGANGDAMYIDRCLIYR